MNLLTKKISEHPTWVFFAVTAVVVVLGIVLYNLLFTQNIIVTANNGSHLRPSFMGPLSLADKTAAGANVDKAIAEKK